MATTDLLFEAGAAPSTDLVFGADYIPPAVAFALAATLPPPSFSGRVLCVVTVEVTGTLPAPAFTGRVLPVIQAALSAGAALPGLAMLAEAPYVSNTARPTVGLAHTPWQVAHARPLGVGQGQDEASAAPSGWSPRWQCAGASAAGVGHPLPQTMDHTRYERHSPFGQGTPVGLHRGFSHEDASPEWFAYYGPFQGGAKERRGTMFRHQDADRTKRGSRVARHQVARLHRRSWSTNFQPATARLRGWGSRYREAVPPPAGLTLYTWPPDAVPGGPSGPQHLLFDFPFGFGGPYLVFGLAAYDPGAPAQTFVVPVQKVYL